MAFLLLRRRWGVGEGVLDDIWVEKNRLVFETLTLFRTKDPKIITCLGQQPQFHYPA